MKKRTYAGCMAALAMTLQVSAQVPDWSTGGNFINTNEWFGADGNSTIPLQIRHDANQPIEWYSNAIARMRLSPNVTSFMGPFNEFPNVQRDGFMLLSGQADAYTNANSRAPFTRLHLVDDIGTAVPLTYAQEHGFRPWQRNGITFTGNSDQGYIGQQYNGNDVTDMVIHWSDNPSPSPSGTDRLKFVFTTQFNAGAARGAATLSGIEAMRFWPATALSVNVGIGDFAPPAIGDPTERLDILDGNVRIRALPDPGNQATGPFKYMVVDDSPLGNAQRGVVRWTTLPVDCKWTQFGGVNNNDLWTAVGTATDCPNYDNFVGVGTAAPWGKLHVKWTGPQGWQNTFGLFSELDGEAAGKTAGLFQATGTGTSHIAVDAFAQDALGVEDGEGNIAVRALSIAGGAGSTAYHRAIKAETRIADAMNVGQNVLIDALSFVNTPTIGRNYGVRSWLWNLGEAHVGLNCAGDFWSWQTLCTTDASTSGESVGVSARAEGGQVNYGLKAFAPLVNDCGSISVAAYVMGTGVITDGPWGPSDESLKTNIEDFSADASQDILSQVPIHSFQYNTDQFPIMGLPLGQQVGVLAQEVAAVAPQLVKDMVHPAMHDREGNEIQPAIPYKAVNLLGFTPYLISGHQSQGQQIQQLQEMVAAQGVQLAQMQEMLAACCAAAPTDSDHRMQMENGALLFGKDRALVIQPNPFSEPPTVHYTLERAGRMQLIANSADGKQLRVLHDAELEAGDYQLVWDTNTLQPGMYYLTLLLDSEPVVKKAVKVRR